MSAIGPGCVKTQNSVLNGYYCLSDNNQGPLLRIFSLPEKTLNVALVLNWTIKTKC